MRVLFFSTAFPQPGDPSRSPYNLHRCAALAKNHQVVAVSPVSWFDRWKRQTEEKPGLVGQLPVHYPTFFYPAGLFRSSHAWWMRQSVRRLVERLFATHRPDVVLSYWTYPDGDVASNLAMAAGIPSVALAGGSDVLVIAQGDAAGRRVRRVFERVDAITTVSDHLKGRICALGISPERVHVLPSAVDTDMFNPGDKREARAALGLDPAVPVLVWVGRMVAVKGLDDLLGACRVLEKTSAFRLCLIGDGPLRDALVARVSELGLSDRVRFIGRVLQPDLPRWYRAADAAVLPSLSEGIPNVLLEAHACGRPFVATAVGGIPSLAIAGYDELVAPADPDALAAAIHRRLSRVSDTGPPRVAGGWDASAARLAEVLERVVQQHRGSGRRERSPALDCGEAGDAMADKRRPLEGLSSPP